MQSNIPTREDISERLKNVDTIGLDSVGSRNIRRHEVIVSYLNNVNISIGEKEKILSDLVSYSEWENG